MTGPRKEVIGCALGAMAVTASMLIGSPAPASADTIEELGQKVNEAADAYAQAIANVELIEHSIGENEEKISAVESEIPQQREKSKGAIRTLYKMSQNRNGLLDIVLSSEDFNSLISTVTYLNSVESRNATEAERLVKLQEELQNTESQLKDQKAEAEAQREAANEALRQAEELRKQAVEEAARRAAEEAARKAAEEAARAQREAEAAAQAQQEAAQQQAAQQQTQPQPGANNGAASSPETQPAPEPQQPSGGTEPAPEPQQPSEEPAPAPEQPSEPEEQPSERDAFVQEWTGRIDNYLAGSPLAGYGYAFAEAAYDYGVDPRWSPAISSTESTKGAFCFRPHNAWGWGSASWPDWDTAIRAHVAGLSAGYGYTISEEAAQKYCPPSWQDWYTATLSEMNKI